MQNQKQKSLVLVTVDCLRADHVGFMGYDRPTTPFLDSLAAQSFIFSQAIVAGAPTYYSFPAIMASRHALDLGRDLIGLAPGEPSLATAFKNAGYATAAFSAANPYISSRFGYQQGFDTFRDFLDGELAPSAELQQQSVNSNGWASKLNQKLQQASGGSGSLSTIYNELYFQYCLRWASPEVKSMDSLRSFPVAHVMVDQARDWLASVGDSPFFLWLHLMDPHAPYYPTEEAMELMGHSRISQSRARYINSFWNRSDLGPKRLAGHREEIIALYDSGIRWVDEQMSQFIESLRSFNVWNNCIFALTADHGEEFLDHEGRFHSPLHLPEELIHVPLLLRVPGFARNEISKSVFSMLDLAPTLLDASQVPVPQSFHGCSRWQQVSQGVGYDATAISECVHGCTNPFHPENRTGARVLAVREGKYKLVVTFDPPKEKFYDLDADPQERLPLPDSTEKPVRRRLLERACEHIKRSIDGRDNGLRLQAQLQKLRLEWSKSTSRDSDINAAPVAS